MGKVLLVLLLVVVPALGFLNYRRNAHLDAELENRVYATLSAEDLEALSAAYQSQVDDLATRVADNPQGADEMDSFAPADLQGKVKGFESFQGYNRHWRRMRAELFEQEAALKEIQREQSIRARGLDDPINRVKRRVLTP
jgi:hypothetical protein